MRFPNDYSLLFNTREYDQPHSLSALDSLGFSQYKAEARAVLVEAKAVAAKKRRASTKLENLGIPEEELLRQQQELFAKVRNITSIYDNRVVNTFFEVGKKYYRREQTHKMDDYYLINLDLVLIQLGHFDNPTYL